MNYLLRFGEEYRQYTCPAYMIKINQSNNISDPSEINLMYEFASRGKNFPRPIYKHLRNTLLVSFWQVCCGSDEFPSFFEVGLIGNEFIFEKDFFCKSDNPIVDIAKMLIFCTTV